MKQTSGRIMRIDHVGIAVESLESRLPFWAEALGLAVDGIETVDSERVKVAFLPTGPSRVELLEATDDDSTIAGFIARRGPGVHHLTFAVDDLTAVLARLRSKNVPLVGDAPRIGAGGTRVAFVHPKAAGGVLIELVERTEQPGDAAAPQGGIEAGAIVLMYLRDPQEKLWGMLRRLDPAGVVLQGIDLSSFDDWVAQIERGEESVVGPSVLFVPMGRVDKLLLDQSSGHLPSLAERFLRRTGREVKDVLAQG